MNCNDLADRLTTVVDGGATEEDEAAVAQHVATCDDCRHTLHAQTTARTVLRVGSAQLAVTAPPVSRLVAPPTRIDSWFTPTATFVMRSNEKTPLLQRHWAPAWGP